MLITAGLSMFMVAGWFGPSNLDECIQQFAVPAASKYLMAEARNQCAVAFDETKHRVLRSYALCVAKAIPAAKENMALTLIRDSCDTANPTPACPEAHAFNFAADRCEWTCPKGQEYVSKTNSCVWLEGQGPNHICNVSRVYDEASKSCVDIVVEG